MAGYVGFKKLSDTLSKKQGVSDPAGLAAFIGRKKFGASKFNTAAAKGKKLGPGK